MGRARVTRPRPSRSLVQIGDRGDDAPTSWDASTLDYGWGSDHGAAFPSYLELETRAIGDDGGYAIEIIGDFPRRGASRFQRPTGFEVTLVDAQSVEHPCHSGLFGQGEQCSTNIPARILRAYSPSLDVGAYDVVVRYDGTEQNVGTINARRRTRTAHEYELRAALPSAYATGVRRMELDRVLDSSATDEPETDARDAHESRRAVTRGAQRERSDHAPHSRSLWRLYATRRVDARFRRRGGCVVRGRARRVYVEERDHIKRRRRATVNRCTRGEGDA